MGSALGGPGLENVEDENFGKENPGLVKTKSMSELVPDWDSMSKKEKKKMRKKIRKGEKKTEHKQERKTQKKENLVKKAEQIQANKIALVPQTPKRITFDTPSFLGSGLKTSFSLFDKVINSKNQPEKNSAAITMTVPDKTMQGLLNEPSLNKCRSEIIHKTQTYDLTPLSQKVSNFDDSMLKKRAPEPAEDLTSSPRVKEMKFKREKRCMVRALKRSQEYLDQMIEKLHRSQSVRYYFVFEKNRRKFGRKGLGHLRNMKKMLRMPVGKEILNSAPLKYVILIFFLNLVEKFWGERQ